MVSWFRRNRKEAPSAVCATLEIHRPWARRSSAAPREMAGYLTITNTGQASDRLTGAASTLAETVEICGIKVAGADIEMRRLDNGLTVHPGESKVLKPRGYHLLLRGVSAPLAAGARLPVVLTFEKAGPVAVELAVEAPGPVGEAVLDEARHPG